MAPRRSQTGGDVRACLAAVGGGPEVIGGVALLGLGLPGLDLAIDAVVVLSRGVLVIVAEDLPDPALRLDAPIDGPWLVDGWRLVRADGSASPVGDVLAAANAVAARLESPGAPALPVAPVVAVGPYAGSVVQPPGDVDRGLRVFVPSARGLLRLATELTKGVRPCGADAAAALLRTLAPHLVDRDLRPLMAAEGFSG